MPDKNSIPLLREAVNYNTTSELAKRIKKAWPKFNSRAFNNTLKGAFDSVSLAARCTLVREALHQHLPNDFELAMAIILDSLGSELSADGLENIELGSANGLINWSLGDYAAYYGQDHFDISMNALREITKRFSAEGSIRHFIVQHEKRTLDVLHEWAQDPNPHVRRLVSEGTRPRLPLLMQLPKFKQDPSPIIPLLNKLRNDPCLYVRRSVANNLNDIAKDNPDHVTTLLKKWNKTSTEHTPWMTRHALRTLIKQGNPDALLLTGYSPNVKLTVEKFKVAPKHIPLGNSLNMELTLQSRDTKSAQLMIDYVIHHMKANGKTSPKVFKWCKKSLAPGETLNLSKKHPIREITTRKYYEGKHEVELQINGKRYELQQFNLKL